MKKILVLICLNFILFEQQPILAAVMDTVIVKGVLQEKSNDKIVLRHPDGGREEFATSAVQNLTQLKVSDQVTMIVKVDPQIYFSKPHLNFKMPSDFSIKTIKQTWFHVVAFMAALDQLPNNKNKSTGWIEGQKINGLKRQFLNLINAYAEDRPYTCFYAGWPTRSVSGSNTCAQPWDATSVSQYTACGASGVYRCNPVVFGPGVGARVESDPTHIVANDNIAAGMCVRASGVNSIVAACASATVTRIDDHLKQLSTNPDLMSRLQRYLTSVETFCRGSGGTVNAVCLHLNDRLATLRFMTGEEERVCRVLQNPSAPAGTCRAIRISCTQGGNSMVGYVRADQAATFPAANDRRLRAGVVAGDVVRSMGALTRTPCGGDQEESEIGENCVVRATRNLRQEIVVGNPVEGCPSGLCSVFAQCSPPSSDGAPASFTHDVLLTCDCGRMGGGTSAPTLTQMRECQSQQIDQVTVRSPESFSAPAAPNGAGASR